MTGNKIIGYVAMDGEGDFLNNRGLAQAFPFVFSSRGDACAEIDLVDPDDEFDYEVAPAYSAPDEPFNGFGHLKPRKCSSRGGKPIGDYPSEGQEILVFCDGAPMFGKLGSDNYVVGESGGYWAEPPLWKDCQVWYALPTVDVDEDGNLVGLPEL